MPPRYSFCHRPVPVGGGWQPGLRHTLGTHTGHTDQGCWAWQWDLHHPKYQPLMWVGSMASSPWGPTLRGLWVWKIPYIQGQRKSHNKTVGGAQSLQNKILYPLGGRSTTWRTMISKKSLHCCEGSRPHIRLPSLEMQPRGWACPSWGGGGRISTLSHWTLCQFCVSTTLFWLF